MGYLEQFARNRRRKEKSEVLTARLPESLYSEFKAYCDDLGLSISEAVCLLVEHEVTTNKIEANTKVYNANKNVDIKNDDVVKANTKVVKRTTKNSKTNTGKRFTVKQWTVNGELPCPLCKEWFTSTNFSRHAKQQHDSNTYEIFTNEGYLKKVNEMIKEKQSVKSVDQ